MVVFPDPLRPVSQMIAPVEGPDGEGGEMSDFKPRILEAEIESTEASILPKTG